MSKQTIARRVEALEEKSGVARLTEEQVEQVEALLGDMRELLCPVCLGKWQEIDRLPNNERWSMPGDVLRTPKYVDILLTCPDCKDRVVDYLMNRFYPDKVSA